MSSKHVLKDYVYSKTGWPKSYQGLHKKAKKAVKIKTEEIKEVKK